MKCLIVLTFLGAAMAGASSYPASSAPAPGMPSATTTVTYGSSCAPSAADETVSRAAESTPCPSCPVFSVSYASGASTPGANMPTMAAPSAPGSSGNGSGNPVPQTGGAATLAQKAGVAVPLGLALAAYVF